MGSILSALGEFLLQVIAYGLGWSVLRFLTIGRYPPPEPTERQQTHVQGFGVLCLLGFLLAALSLLGD